MDQKLVAKINNVVQRMEIPSAEQEVIPGILWGDHTCLFTPAFWKGLLWLDQNDRIFKTQRLGGNINEEVAACILGGYGIPAQVGMAAFNRLKNADIFQTTPSEDEIKMLLKEPLAIEKKKIKYRFVNQKSKYLCKALKKLSVETPPEQNHLEFRSWLMGFDGIGFKTASWVTRNWFGSDEVAIIDIHIHRAGLLMNLYNTKQTPSKDYLEMESKFLDLAQGLEVKASHLDALIWREMKAGGNMVLRHIRKVVAH